jgi:hypothetical protein
VFLENKRRATGNLLIGRTVMAIVPEALKTCLKVVWRAVYFPIKRCQRAQTNCVFMRVRNDAESDY